MGYINLALRMAREAGELIREYVDGEFTVEEKSSKVDLVTEVDQKSENFIRNRIHEYYPDHKIVGEEGVAGGDDLNVIAESDDYIWIIDPIDGTTNFVHGLPGYTVSIALSYKKEVILGVIYDPTLDEMFWAEKGKGSFLNSKRMTVSEKDHMEGCVLATGYPSDVEGDRAKVIENIHALGPVCSNIRTFGSAALHLAYTASGRMEGFWEHGLNVWDVAAGYLIVKEAGGAATAITGEAYSLTTRGIVASNGNIHENLIESINEN
ncbi:inositol monophosphatase [Bacillus shivajii]|uniref:inositol monophosphatase family protein n=1 Tax=Bacillus shivajii TaxID=1983719 RepID=UPI001CFB281C|nr:inositol monophosphatase family protein [Bacillus shivajii]UCZ52817.1 inositol monophosphatase [Bacillus shivajii]